MNAVVRVGDVLHEPRPRATENTGRGGAEFSRYVESGSYPLSWPAACSGEYGTVFLRAPVLARLSVCPDCRGVGELAA